MTPGMEWLPSELHVFASKTSHMSLCSWQQWNGLQMSTGWSWKINRIHRSGITFWLGSYALGSWNLLNWWTGVGFSWGLGYCSVIVIIMIHYIKLFIQHYTLHFDNRNCYPSQRGDPSKTGFLDVYWQTQPLHAIFTFYEVNSDSFRFGSDL